MQRYILRRILEAVPVIIGISIIAFSMIHLIPGGPAVALLGERTTPEKVAAINERFGLDKPLYEQYFIWVGKLAKGDLGNSVRGNVPVSSEISRRFPATIELSLAALLIAVVIGMPMGIVSALRRNTLIDTATMFFALFGVSIPIFVLGLLLIFLVGVEFGWLPFVGRGDVDVREITRLYTVDSFLAGDWESFKEAIRRLILPSVTLSTIPMAIIARITRSTMLEVLNQDYIRTAHAKGLRNYTVVSTHALRNALLPTVTVIGLQLGGLLSGAVLTETIFSWPGVGRWLFEAIQARDYPIVQAMTLVLALIYVTVNLFVDLLYAALDPRIRYS